MQSRVEDTTGSAGRPRLVRRMIFTIVGVLILVGIIAGIKVLMIVSMIRGMKPPPPSVVSTAKASYQEWQPELRAVGTLRAARGSDLALDVAGLVTGVYVKSGDDVGQGQLLLQLRDSDDIALLHQLEAAEALSQVTYERSQREIAVKVIAQADFDQAAADLKSKKAAVAQQQVNVSKKQLRAPFAGHAGIVTINPGTYLNSGTVVVTLQQLDPVYVDFYVPQKMLADLKVGEKAALTLDAYHGRTFAGTVNAVSPKVDSDTRNVQAEATVPNPDHALTPGMFVNVAVDVGTQQRYLTLPQTSIVYNPYGETVYVVEKKSDYDRQQEAAAAQNAAAQNVAPSKSAKKGPQLPPDTPVVQQTFVTSGPTRGDQVAVLSGIDEGTEVVTSGQIKLKSGVPVHIDNSVQPADNPHPTPQEH
jgi:membrane fusion protein, multidrug efflux system